MADAISSSSTSSGAQTPELQATPVAKSEMDTVQMKEAELSEGGATSQLEDKIDSLLQKQRNELMFELRRLQHGDRPVTGQGNKEAVEQFFQRAIHGEPENEETHDRHRPENVVVEVNALVERRPVSSVLRSTGFRRSLESALRGALSNISTARPTRSFLPQSRRTPPATVNSTSASEQPESLQARGPYQENHQNSTVQPSLNVNANVEINAARVPPPPSLEPLQEVVQEQASVHVVQPPQLAGVNNAQSWIEQHQNDLNPSNQVQPNIWDTVEDAHREAFVQDVSELVQRQLVTGTLSGNFRNVLESRMMDRLNTIGADGQRVQQFVQGIPRTTHHVRNDFSDLGIIGPGQQQVDHLSDEMSVISATAAVAVPYAQSNAAVSRELNSLKAQMKEMMNMMKLQFDLTMDVQRSIRQEVAAAVHTSAAGGAQTESRQMHSRPVNETTCLICTEKLVDTVLYQCGHMCVCHGCGMNLRQRGSNCPVCRAPIRDIIRAYKCNSE